MIYEVRIRPEAEKDLEEATLWYEEQRGGLGQFFLEEIRDKIKIISEQPLFYPNVYRNTRRGVNIY